MVKCSEAYVAASSAWYEWRENASIARNLRLTLVSLCARVASMGEEQVEVMGAVEVQNCGRRS